MRIRKMYTQKNSIIENSNIGDGTVIWHFCTIFNSDIDCDCNIGSHTEIGGAIIGANCRIGNGVFICRGVVIEPDCFISQGVCFSNDKYPTVKKAVKAKLTGKHEYLSTIVKKGAVIGANATILPGVVIGEKAFIGAGAVVTKNVPTGEVWIGNPAKRLK
jgi:UDP-2-acetamido-3-amino-2,3-dideoxy-glucuronate N-acetyltransferase